MQKATMLTPLPAAAASAVAIAGGQVVPPGIRRVGAAGASTMAPAADVSVAVLDSGIFLSHPDLDVVPGELPVLGLVLAAPASSHVTCLASLASLAR